MVTKKVPKGSEIYRCEPCDYISSRKSQYDRHLLTQKHKNVTNVTEFGSEGSAGLCCQQCNKQYKSRMGLWHHIKTCAVPGVQIVPIISEDNAVTIGEPTLPFELNPGMFIELIQQNKDLQNLLLQQAKSHSEIVNKLVEREPVSSNINSNNTINNNQKFNLNFFLNETCKDAMNIQEFMENIRVTFEDLLTIGDSGFVAGVSDILIKQLRDLEVSKRPIHCTDAKRETIYLKDQDAWNKDDKEKSRLKQLIEKIEYKNVVALRDWCNENPDAKVNNTSNNILKDKIYLQTLKGDDQTRNRIIRNLTKEVIVEKEPSPSTDMV